jgi:RNA polymerase sigma-70 factor (ECF subfamily)
MDRADSERHWVELLEKQVWQDPPDRLTELESTLPARLAGCRLRAAEVLAEFSDESLALAIQKSFLWKQAFEELFVNRYTTYLARWFYQWGMNPDQGQELMQQLFCRFLDTRLASFQPDRSFRSYLWQVARNRYIDALRRAHKGYPLETITEPPTGAEGPEDEAVRRETERSIEAALLRLPPTEQRVLRETMNGHSADEIAALLNLPKSRVFVLLFRARRRMEQVLGLSPRKRVRT